MLNQLTKKLLAELANCYQLNKHIITAQVHTEAGLFPLVVSEVKFQAELPLTAHVSHQKFLIVGLDFNNIAL
jgi:hypothetical protein